MAIPSDTIRAKTVSKIGVTVEGSLSSISVALDAEANKGWIEWDVCILVLVLVNKLKGVHVEAWFRRWMRPHVLILVVECNILAWLNP